jgi:hypothetical protein
LVAAASGGWEVLSVKTLIMLAALVALAGPGCSRTPEIRSYRTIHVFPEQENTFEEDVSARKGHPAPPAWLYKPGQYAGARPGSLYFAGISLPKDSLQAARDSAMEDAHRQIVRYLGTTVGLRSDRTGTAVGDTRGGSYEAVTDRVFSTAVADHTVKGVVVRDAYYTAGEMVRDIAKQRVHFAYLLVEFGSQQAGEVVKAAESIAEQEIQTLEKKQEAAPDKQLEDRDAVRLDSLRRLEKKLESLSADDFSL